MLNEISSRGQTAINKNCAGQRLQHVSQQRILAAAAALLFTATKAQKVAEVQPQRRCRQSRRTHQPMLHAREFAFSAGRISFAEIVSDDQTQHGIAEKLECLVVKLARLIFRARRHLFVCPGAMRDGPLQQSAVLKLVRENGFQQVEVRKFESPVSSR